MKTYNTFVDQWTHGQKYYYTTKHRDQKQFYGPCPECGHRTTDYGGSIVCVDDCCMRSANRQCVHSIRPEPDWWNSNINVQKDGNMWCAFYDGFINLQESIAGFGKTPTEAVKDLK